LGHIAGLVALVPSVLGLEAKLKKSGFAARWFLFIKHQRIERIHKRAYPGRYFQWRKRYVVKFLFSIAGISGRVD